MISMSDDQKDPTPESLDSITNENRKASDTIKNVHIKPSPKRWIIVILFFIFSANTAFQVKWNNLNFFQLNGSYNFHFR